MFSLQITWPANWNSLEKCDTIKVYQQVHEHEVFLTGGPLNRGIAGAYWL